VDGLFKGKVGEVEVGHYEDKFLPICPAEQPSGWSRNLGFGRRGVGMIERNQNREVIGVVEVVQSRPGEERDKGRRGRRHVDATRGSSMEV
jgi:hypothetical protein